MGQETETIRKSNNWLAASLVNLIVILPSLTIGLIVFGFIGGIAEGDGVFKVALSLVAGYILASITAAISFGISRYKSGKGLNTAKKVVLIAFLIGLFMPFVYEHTGIVFKDASLKRPKLERKVIYTDNDIKITQEKVKYNRYDMEIYISVENINNSAATLIEKSGIQIQTNSSVGGFATMKEVSHNNYCITIKYKDIPIYGKKPIETIYVPVKKDEEHINFTIEFKK